MKTSFKTPCSACHKPESLMDDSKPRRQWLCASCTESARVRSLEISHGALLWALERLVGAVGRCGANPADGIAEECQDVIDQARALKGPGGTS